MPILRMFKGLPASGKTTAAKKLVTLGWVRVNRDDIREELQKEGWIWSRERETKDVIPVRDSLIKEALLAGQNVVSDDTNLSQKVESQLRKIAEECRATFEVDDSFLKVGVATCIERDAKREKPVGEEVIKKMAKSAGMLTVPKTIPYDPSLSDAIICDLDGTLALTGGRRSVYDASKCHLDDINLPIKRILDKFFAVPILFVSGREEKFVLPTLKFLDKAGFDLDLDEPGGECRLWMRPTGDFRNDTIIKKEIYETHIKGKYNVIFALDDRDRIVKMWRDEGLCCLQVAEGDF